MTEPEDENKQKKYMKRGSEAIGTFIGLYFGITKGVELINLVNTIPNLQEGIGHTIKQYPTLTAYLTTYTGMKVGYLAGKVGVDLISVMGQGLSKLEEIILKY
jgi:hypothetical protein